jgi:hypothetical protein
MNTEQTQTGLLSHSAQTTGFFCLNYLLYHQISIASPAGENVLHGSRLNSASLLSIQKNEIFNEKMCKPF